MNAPENYRTEVVPYAEATWAPHLPGCRFRWAWRVLNPDGSLHLTGVSNGSAEEARAQAENAAHRRVANNRGIVIPRTAIIKKSRVRPDTRASGMNAGKRSAPLLSDEG
ncbi:MAG: hypothetical protein ACYC9J_06625 [Sulfuricaulis sp.]